MNELPGNRMLQTLVMLLGLFAVINNFDNAISYATNLVGNIKASVSYSVFQMAVAFICV